MNFNFYDKRLLASAKCGSRYLDSIYGVSHNDGLPTPTTLPKGTKLTSDIIPVRIKVTEYLKPFSKLDLSEVNWIIIRPPMELLITAVHTELILNWTRNPNGISEKMMIHNLTFSDYKCGHYQSNLYKDMFLKSIDYPNIKFVNLNDLTTFCKWELNLHKQYKPSEFDFNGLNGYNMSKDMCMEYFKTTYPYYHSMVMKNVSIDDLFYNLIMKSKKLWKVTNNENYQKEISKKFL